MQLAVQHCTYGKQHKEKINGIKNDYGNNKTWYNNIV